jgi:TolB-like protein/DNA-binding winged helix-turn-helix (wHTH) protein
MNEAMKPPLKGRFRLHDLEIDLDKRSIRCRGQAIPLPDLSFRLLAVLLRHAPDTISKDDLIREVWGDVVVSDEALAQRVRLLRQALGENALEPRYLVSVRGRGYRLLGAAKQIGSDGRKTSFRKPLLALAATAIVVVAVLSWVTTRPEVERVPDAANSIAVLPFADLSEEQSYQFFADGMQEELLARLARLQSLDVLSRTSVANYRSTELSLPDIAEQIGASLVIEGSVRLDQDRVRITVQLIDAKTDTHLWTENYDRQLSVQNIFSIQQDVADQISEALELEYKKKPLPEDDQLPTENLDAYRDYLLGRYHTFRQTPQDLELAVRHLKSATALDTEFAEAYASLGWAYAFLGTNYGGQRPRDIYPKAREAAIKALSLDSELADARTLYADILTWFDWDFSAAEREYLKTIELDPLNVLGYALFLSSQQRHDEAIAVVEQRVAANPNDTYVHVNAAWRYLNARQYERAIQEAGLSGSHTDTKSIMGFANMHLGNIQEAVRIFEADLQDHGRTPRQLANLAYAYFEAGRTADGQALLAEYNAIAEERYVSPSLIAAAYFAAGDADTGFALLEEAVAERSRGVIFLTVDHMLDNYREDPRYLAIIRSIVPE